jgi:predicted transcriptional regulator YdeE
MPLHLAQADEALELSGAFDGTRFQDVHLRASQIDVTFLQRLVPLPDFVQGRATLQAHLSGTLTTPVLTIELTLRPEPQQPRPFEQLHATLVYDQQQLQSEVRVHQANREVLTVAARLPIDLALTPLDLEQRLLASPVALHVHLQQPDLAALSRWQSALPNLTGTLQGDLQLQGTYANLDLDADVRLQQWGLQGKIEQVSAPIRLQATFGMLTPDPGPAQAGWRHRLLPRIEKVTLHVPTLRGQLPGPNQPLRSLQVQDLLVQAAGQWGPEGFDGTLERLQAQIGVTGWPRAEVRLAGSLTPQRLDLAYLHVRLPQSEVHGSGSLTLPHQQVQLHLDMPRLLLDEIGFALPAPLPRLVQGVIDLRGSVSAPQVEAHLQYAEAQLDLGLAAQLEAPRYENGKPLVIAGLRSLYTSETMNNLPAQWVRFATYIGKIPGQVGRTAYGACWNFADGIDYLTGVEVSSSSELPSEFNVVAIPAQKYAVFSHRDHVSKLRDTLDAIWHKWFPEFGHEAVRGVAGAPDFFERYSEEFDPRTGIGGMEVWVPVKS